MKKFKKKYILHIALIYILYILMMHFWSSNYLYSGYNFSSEKSENGNRQFGFEWEQSDKNKTLNMLQNASNPTTIQQTAILNLTTVYSNVLTDDELAQKIQQQLQNITTSPLFIPYNASEFPLKIYVYDFPDDLQYENCLVEKYHSDCIDLSQNGFGRLMYQDDNLYCHNTWQFALEKIVHHKMLASPYRTEDYKEANVFYLPFYSGVSCFCRDSSEGVNSKNQLQRVQQVIQYLETHSSGAFKHGKQHLMALGKIEKEHTSNTCPLLATPELAPFIFIGIEKATHQMYLSHPINNGPRSFSSKNLIVAPYPSYGHLSGAMGVVKESTYHQKLFSHERRVIAFMAAGPHNKNTIREEILKQYHNASTTLSYFAHMKLHDRNSNLQQIPTNNNTSQNMASSTIIDRIWYVTQECARHQFNETLTWMKYSVFCIQPPGDSPTRKSFYDAVISGCIPVVMPYIKKPLPVYPFDTKVNYNSFTVTIREEDIFRGKKVLEILKAYMRNTELIKKMQWNLLRVLQYLQYGAFEGDSGKDAMGYIYEELKQRLEVQQKT